MKKDDTECYILIAPIIIDLGQIIANIGISNYAAVVTGLFKVANDLYKVVNCFIKEGVSIVKILIS